MVVLGSSKRLTTHELSQLAHVRLPGRGLSRNLALKLTLKLIQLLGIPVVALDQRYQKIHRTRSVLEELCGWPKTMYASNFEDAVGIAVRVEGTLQSPRR